MSARLAFHVEYAFPHRPSSRQSEGGCLVASEARRYQPQGHPQFPEHCFSYDSHSGPSPLEPVNRLVYSHWAFSRSIFISVWAHMGFFRLILLAGLQAIPRDVYEASMMDRP